MSDAAIVLNALAERLGLPVTSGRLHGSLDGVPLTVVVQLRVQNPHARNTHVLDLGTGTLHAVQTEHRLAVDVTAPFRPRLDAGLKVGPVGGLQALRSAGRDTFAERFTLRATEPERLAALVGPAAQEALDRAFVVDPGPGITDGGVTWSALCAAPWPEVDTIAAAIREVATVWRAVTEAGARVRPPAGTEAAMVLLAGVSRPDGVALNGCPAGLLGRADGLDLSLTVAPGVSGVLARFSVALPEALPGGPKVVREAKFGWFDRLGALLAGRSEIEVGSKDFDRRFAVRSLRPEALRELLRPEVQAAMLALDARVPVQLGSTAVDGSGLVPADALPAVADGVFALARALAR